MSSKKAKGSSLNEKLSSLIHAKPSEVESDNDDFTTVDKIAPQSNDSDYSADELDVTKFRKIISNFLAEEDSKYSGKGVSRKELKDFSSDDVSDTEEHIKCKKAHGSTSTSEEEEEVEDETQDEEETETEEEETENEGEESGCDSDKSPQMDSENISHKFNNLKVEEVNFNKEIFSQLEKDIEKGKAIKSQLQLWDFFLECRMKFQNCLVASNQFPDYQNVVKFKGNPEFDESVNETKKSLKHLLRSLLSLQEALLNSNEEFINSVKSTKKSVDSEVDSEIDSELESENEVSTKVDNNNHPNINLFGNNFKKLNDFSHEINKRHKDFESYRNSTIQKWNDKTRIGSISSKNFSAFEQSVLKQIEQVLKDKQRLITRTQVKRSNYHILGLDTNEDEPCAKKQASEDNENLNYNPSQRSKTITHKEIFDDDDFYHQFLSELIRRRANNITDPVLLGRQWTQLQKIRKKMKKIVDTKASKGRKIRFVVHPKLVNFMMPTFDSVVNENSRMELINSLFGKNKMIAK